MGIGKYLPALGLAGSLVSLLKNDKIKDTLSELEKEKGIAGAKGTGIRNRIRALSADAPDEAAGMKRGGSVKKPSRKASGGSVSSKGKSSASKRADGIAKKGKTRGKIV